MRRVSPRNTLAPGSSGEKKGGQSSRINPRDTTVIQGGDERKRVRGNRDNPEYQRLPTGLLDLDGRIHRAGLFWGLTIETD
jgi:hypothetical protein